MHLPSVDIGKDEHTIPTLSPTKARLSETCIRQEKRQEKVQRCDHHSQTRLPRQGARRWIQDPRNFHDYQLRRDGDEKIEKDEMATGCIGEAWRILFVRNE